MVKPAGKKQAARHLISVHQISERRACKLVGLSRTAYRHVGAGDRDDQLRHRLRELATKHSALGYLMLHGLLRQEGLVVNRKRTWRLYTEEGLQVRTKRRKKLKRVRLPLSVPTTINERWSMDFVSDQLADGRRFRVLNIVDDYSRELVGQLAAISISGHRVARFLDELAETRGLPRQIVCDNGPEFTSKAMFFWSRESGARLNFIQPGKPIQNAFVESLNGKFRNECLNQHWFRSLADAEQRISAWREHYNHVRPHSSLNYVPPVVFAKQAA